MTRLGARQDHLVQTIERTGNETTQKLTEIERRNASRWTNMDQGISESGQETKGSLKRMEGILSAVQSTGRGREQSDQASVPPDIHQPGSSIDDTDRKAAITIRGNSTEGHQKRSQQTRAAQAPYRNDPSMFPNLGGQNSRHGS